MTRTAPVWMSTMIARLMITSVSGFVSPEIIPANFCKAVSRSFPSKKASFSLSSRLKARMTRTPVRFSLVIFKIVSSAPCTFLYIGFVTPMTVKTTRDKSGIVTTKMSAACTSMVNAMTMAPNTINGERRNRRSTMLMPFCT